jgi:RNA polymerase sigma factor (sigma-70 family)
LRIILSSSQHCQSTSLDWINYIKTNENKALTEVYTLYRDECMMWLQKEMKCSEEDSIEVFQMAVIILYDNVATGKLVELTSSIKTYLFGVAKLKAWELTRKAEKTVVGVDDALLKYVAEENEFRDNTEELTLVEKSLEELGQPCKTVLQLYYYKNKSMEEISQELGYKNADTTKNQKYKCLKRLQNIFYVHKAKISVD